MVGSLEEVFRQKMRLIAVIRKPKEGSVLSQLLDDQPVTAENVMKLLSFARRHMDDSNQNGERIFPKIGKACSEYLESQGVKSPAVEVKPTRSKSILDEMEEEDRLRRLRLEIWCARNNRTYCKTGSDGRPEFDDCVIWYAKDPEFRKVIDAIDGGKS